MAKTNNETKRKCVIKESKKIYKALWGRFNNLGLSYSDIVADAAHHDRKFTSSSLSRYYKQFDEDGNFKEAVKGSLSQEDLIWLCLRYCINISLTVEAAPYDQKVGIKNAQEHMQ